MACDAWRDKLDAYLDGELESQDAAALSAHMRTCADCASEAVERVQLKRSVAMAGKRYEPSSQLRAKIAKGMPTTSPWKRQLQWAMLALPALAVAVVSVWLIFFARGQHSGHLAVFRELADQHVATLASSTPVDVISTDRHTVKPWFEGRVPFSFNLPEVQGTDFTLLGGRVTYVDQTPGAHLLYQLRKHRISVFIFPDRNRSMAGFPSGTINGFSFNVESWSQNGLRYFVVGDVGAGDIQMLSKLMQDAR